MKLEVHNQVMRKAVAVSEEEEQVSRMMSTLVVGGLTGQDGL